MENLINILKEETKSLKEQYIQKTMEWAQRNFEMSSVRTKWREVQWCEYFGLEPRVANKGTNMEFLTFPNNFHNSSTSKTYCKLRDEYRKISEMGLDVYTSKEVKKAELHYENSIIKLASRIIKKGLVQENLEVVTSHIGVNINTTLTDGIKTVRAFTIIAEGEIQRPHYRYLIK